MLKYKIAKLAVVAFATVAGSLAAPVTASASASAQLLPLGQSVETATGYGATVSDAKADAYDLLRSEFFGCGAPALVASGSAGDGTVWAEIKAVCSDN